MLPRRPHARLRRLVPAALATLLATVLTGAVLSVPAYAANPVTPGSFRGYGFDQCEAPSQGAMSTWIRSSPFRAAGIYISGNSRACRRQTNLTSAWVSTQLAAGWHLMPITLGPQASCSTRFPRYGASIDPVISASSANTYGAARSQGALEARRAVVAARTLGIVPGSTLFYDLEAFNTSISSCTWSSLWFLSYWTRELHRYGYASGVYSSAASGIRVLDDARVRTGNQITMPDQVWIADWNNRADTASSYIRSDGWLPYNRAHQYRGGHNETWGGVTINIDRNYLDLRTPRLAGTPAPAPAPAPGPAYTGTSTADPMCTTRSINRTAYRPTSPARGSFVVPLQCLLKQRLLYRYEVTGTWNPQTSTALRAFQGSVGHLVRDIVTLNDWVSLITAGTGRSALVTGSTGADVTRVQRALNAAGSPYLTVTGTYDAATATAVGRYQAAVGISPTRTVGTLTWNALVAGRI
jgi:peptidoglycan hydrolase-like protein with peptidoglycan-binding domain